MVNKRIIFNEYFMYTIQMPDNKAFTDLNFFEKFQKNS